MDSRPSTGRLAQLSNTSLSVREVCGSNRTQHRQRLATAAKFLRGCVIQALTCGDGLRQLLYAPV